MADGLRGAITSQRLPVDQPQEVAVQAGEIDDSIPPEKAADLAVSLHIRVYTIGVVSDISPGRNPEIDEELLTAIADRTDGKYFVADSPQALQDIYDEIGSLERSRVGRESFEGFTEYAPWFAAGAALLLALELTLRGTALRRAPA